MAEATFSSDRWVRDADLEGQKDKQTKQRYWSHLRRRGNQSSVCVSSTFTRNTPTNTDVLGAMSIIFWTITLVVVVKYMLIVLLADDNGEGGTFALYALICRHAGMRPANNGAPDASDVTLSHYSRHSGDRTPKACHVASVSG
ncbi:hypothetical protein ABBQ38_006623 [Trebouxia sp. C0009 RCD-2024]